MPDSASPPTEAEVEEALARAAKRIVSRHPTALSVTTHAFPLAMIWEWSAPDGWCRIGLVAVELAASTVRYSAYLHPGTGLGVMKRVRVEVMS